MAFFLLHSFFGKPSSSGGNCNSFFISCTTPEWIFQTIRKQFPHYPWFIWGKGFKKNLLPVYTPREQNVIQRVLKDHFPDFEKNYDDHHADKYGKYRIIRIKEAVEKFLECGDYSKGVARIKCTNPQCGYEYFRPFCRFAQSCLQKLVPLSKL